MHMLGIACSRGARAFASTLPTLPPLASSSSPSFTRAFTSSRAPLQRQVLGRITPKRIAVRVPAGSGPHVDPSLPKASIWRPIVFILAFGGGSYVFAAQYTNVDTQKWFEKLGGGASGWWRRGVGQPSDKDIARAKQLQGAKDAQAMLNHLPETLSFLPRVLLVPILRVYVTTQEYLLNSPSAAAVPMQLAVGMGVVFLAWKVKRWEPFMRKWFLHRPVIFSSSAKADWANCLTMFTSTISHQSLPHYFFNSFALTSFGAAAYLYLSTPDSSGSGSGSGLTTSTHTPHFLAFLLLGGLASSLASHLWTNIVRLPRLLKALSSPARLSSAQALAAQQAILPSLGASGAIYSALVVTACAMPDSQVGIILIPFISFPIWLGVGGMVAVDVIGLIRGWKMFDHVAHLGGAVFGLIYYQYGRQAWVWLRKQLGAPPQGGAGIY